MRLSTILELLFIFLLVAFAAYGRVIEPNIYIIDKKASSINNSTFTSLKQATENVNKYCLCNENTCNCCRDFHIPLVQLSGPGCASLQYLQDDKLAMQLSIGDNILSSNIINGKNPKPVCVPLPGGFSKFCGKIYSIKKEADKHFKACLGLELRSAAELEASLRVSCFRFGPDGLKLRPAEPLPASITETVSDDDYDDIFGLGDDEDDDEDDDDYEKVSPDNNIVSSSSINEEKDQEQDEDDEDDLLGFGALFDIFTGDDDSSVNKKIKVTSTPFPISFAIPILTTSNPTHIINESTVSKNPISTVATIEPIISSPTASSHLLTVSIPNFNYKNNSSEMNSSHNPSLDTSYFPLEETTDVIIDKDNSESTTSNIDIDITELINIPIKNNTNKVDKFKLKKKITINKKKTNITAQISNTINNDTIKIHEIDQNDSINDDIDNEYDYDTSQDNDENDEFEESNEKIIDSEQNDEDDSDENDKQVDSSEMSVAGGVNYEDEDSDDETEENEDEEEAVIDAFVNKNNKDNIHINKYKKKNDKSTGNKTDDLQEYDADYGYGLTELLSRKQHSFKSMNKRKFSRKIGRQSKVMRL